LSEAKNWSIAEFPPQERIKSGEETKPAHCNGETENYPDLTDWSL